MVTDGTHRQIRELPQILKQLLKDPIGTMKSPISMVYPASFSLICGTALVSGAVVGLLSHNFWDFLIGLLVFPITSLVIALVFSFFIYYFFSLFHLTFLDFRRLISVVSLAMVPFFLFHSVSGYLPPIDLIGFAFTGLLLVVGLVEQFSLDRKLVVKLVAGIGVAFFIAWSISQFRSSSEKEERQPVPRSLDELERDIKNDH